MTRILKLYPSRSTPDTQSAVIDWKNHRRFYTTGLPDTSVVTVQDTEMLIAAGFLCLEFTLPNGQMCRFPLCEGSTNPHERQSLGAVQFRRTSQSYDTFDPAALYMTEEVVANVRRRRHNKWCKGNLYRPDDKQ